MYVYDSRSIQKDATFLCLPGGERYLTDVLQQGVKTIFYLNRVQLAQLAHDVHGKPSNSLVVIGVTGTNGKTSVCHFLQQALVQLGQKPAVQGTLTHNLTTPESLDTQAFMAKHLSLGGTHFVMEVSSHGIAQNRIDCIDFDVTCLTNISQDHLDYHGTMDDYQRVKYSFMNHYPGQSIFPEDFLSLPEVKNNVVFGMFNQANLKAAAAILLALGFEQDPVYAALETVSGAPGRFETVISSAPFDVVVDYAHSPAGLDGVLASAKQIAAKRGGRLLVCFGCGGDRDRQKRPIMGKVAQEWADVIVVTSDNPRTEDPSVIIHDVLSGMDGQKNITKTIDRRDAIACVLAKARTNDVVVVAGKGHETCQIIGKTSFEFNDKTVIKEQLAILGYL